MSRTAHLGYQNLWKSDRKSTRLNSSHLGISYAVFCLKKKKYARVGQDVTRIRREAEEVDGVERVGEGHGDERCRKGKLRQPVEGAGVDRNTDRHRAAH